HGAVAVHPPAARARHDHLADYSLPGGSRDALRGDRVDPRRSHRRTRHSREPASPLRRRVARRGLRQGDELDGGPRRGGLMEALAGSAARMRGRTPADLRRLSYLSLFWLAARECLRVSRLWTQTVVAPVVSSLLFVIVFGLS